MKTTNIYNTCTKVMDTLISLDDNYEKELTDVSRDINTVATMVGIWLDTPQDVDELFLMGVQNLRSFCTDISKEADTINDRVVVPLKFKVAVENLNDANSVLCKVEQFYNWRNLVHKPDDVLKTRRQMDELVKIADELSRVNCIKWFESEALLVEYNVLSARMCTDDMNDLIRRITYNIMVIGDSDPKRCTELESALSDLVKLRNERDRVATYNKGKFKDTTLYSALVGVGGIVTAGAVAIAAHLLNKRS